ncbi:hypothetical protein V2J09_019390 [Rumex salicifolius]
MMSHFYIFFFLSTIKFLPLKIQATCDIGCDLAMASYYITKSSNLTYISKLFSKPIPEILQYNPQIPSQDQIQAGSRLNVPFSCDCINGSFLGHSFSYVTQYGDTYEKIASYYANLTTADWLDRENSYQENLVPALVAINVVVNCSCGDPNVSKDYGLFITYPLRPGENLSSVAADTGVQEKYLQEYNQGVVFSSGSGLVFVPAKDQNGTFPPLIIRKAGKKIGLLGGVISAAVVAVLILGFCLYFTLHKRKKADSSKSTCSSEAIHAVEDDPESRSSAHGSGSLVEFPYQELADATTNFTCNKIGEGGFGLVYYAELRAQKAAIKSLKKEDRTGFLAEIKILANVNHVNLVRLIGYCIERGLFLVYEFIENGNLAQHLRDAGRRPLPWSTRLQIALDSARGLEYIHEQTYPGYIHLDVKPSNILIDQSFHAKVADFGTTKLREIQCGTTHTDNVKGTRGYMPPEYIQYGFQSTMVDVYAFGVVLFELISAKQAIIMTGEHSFVYKTLVSVFEDALTSPDSEQALLKLVDPRLGHDYPSDEVHKLALLAKTCTDEESTKRPSMRSVVVALSMLSSATQDWSVGLKEKRWKEKPRKDRLSSKKGRILSANIRCDSEFFIIFLRLLSCFSRNLLYNQETSTKENMATLEEIWVSAGVNISSAIAFLLAFAFLRLQPVNDKFYYPKWYLKGLRDDPTEQRGLLANKFVNLDVWSYIKFLNWMPDALRMPESDLIEHAGLDAAVFLRIYLTGLKIFIPITVLALAILVPVNLTNNTLASIARLTYSNIDKLSISNVPLGSQRLWIHIIMAYVFSFWTCYVLYKEYEIIAKMRLQYLMLKTRCADQFTVLVRNVPPDEDESISELVEHFFLVNHPDHYLTYQIAYDTNHLADLVEEYKDKRNKLESAEIQYSKKPSIRPIAKTGWRGLRGKTVDALDYFGAEVDRLTKEISEERQKLKTDPMSIIPVAFVSFKTRWGAAVAAQTQQTRNPTVWLTEWAPEPCEMFWPNLAIPYVNLSIRRLLMVVAFFFLTFFSMIPISFIQSLASLEGLEETLPFLQPFMEAEWVKSFVQGFLPGLVLKLFLIFLPAILMAMSKFEGYISVSSIERRAASRFYLFNLVNTFLGSIITGSALEQLNTFLKQSADQIPKTIGVAVPMKATFFITFIMVDGWAGVAGEILRLTPLAIYHLKHMFLVRTEKDRKDAMDAGTIDFPTLEPQIQLYILLGLVYAVVTPILLPFILIFFAFAYLVYRHQVINVYHKEYESGGAFWPDVHRRIVYALLISHFVLIGLLSTKHAADTTPFLIPLPLLTIWFHKRFCKACFESAFDKYPVEEAMMKDTVERARDPTFDIRGFLEDAYVHPAIKQEEEYEQGFVEQDTEDMEDNKLIPTRRPSGI